MFFEPENMCTTAVVIFKESLIKSVDKGEPWVRMYIKMSKVFDSVENYVVLEKLKTLDVKKWTLKWLSFSCLKYTNFFK